VPAERDAVESAIHEWNANHHAATGIILLPVRWETHSYHGSGDRPQAILNKQIVDSGHLLIGIFRNRSGTPTGKAQSGTIEEIEEFRKTGRYVALYFSSAPVQEDADRDQLDALEQYKKQPQQETLYRRNVSMSPKPGLRRICWKLYLESVRPEPPALYGFDQLPRRCI
jgi:hypothetical protein